MKKIILLFITMLFVPAFGFCQQDADGCEDHPLITRFPEARLVWCDLQKFSAYHVATGKMAGYRKIDEWIDLEGSIARYNYQLEDQKSTMSEVYQNYRNAIKRSGFELLAEGFDPNRSKATEVGGRTWVGTAFKKNPLPGNSKSKLFLGSSSSGGYGYIAAKLERSTGNVYAVVAVYQQRKDMVVIQVDIIEEAPLDDGKITVDADYIAREIAMNGTVALYGIYFDFDQSTVKPESKETLDAIAEFMKKHPEINLYVVGHTDMKGSLEYNMKLADARANAVVHKLTAEYNLNKDRLEGKGIGPLAPKSTNDSDDGRTLNRRVELVKKM